MGMHEEHCKVGAGGAVGKGRGGIGGKVGVGNLKTKLGLSKAEEACTFCMLGVEHLSGRSGTV
jgi:hypothetical protein